MEMEAEAEAVAAFVRKEVGEDWDDEEKWGRARFKALSGQRSDWEGQYEFWRDLIIKVARHLRIFIIRPSHVIRLWFRRRPPSGLSPLCLNQVLLEMHRAGDLINCSTSPNPTSLLSHFFRKALVYFLNTNTNNDTDDLRDDDYYILAPLLEEEALRVVNILSENYWTTSCVITITKFQEICSSNKEEEALAILDHLSANGRARRITLKTAADDHLIEGVKVCLDASPPVSTASTTDYSVLHLTWTAENLEKQLRLIDLRYQKTRNSALASLKSENKRAALRFAKELKLASLSRERCTALLDRVEKVLQVITDAESSKKVSEAMQNGAHAIRKNQISIEDVELCLQEVNENIDSLKQLDNVLGSTRAYAEIDDEDIEDEFDNLLLEIKSETTETGFDSSAGVGVGEVLSTALSNLNLKDGSEAECYIKPVDNQRVSKERTPETA